MSNAIEVRDISKKYPSGFEINDLCFNIKKGYITGLIGKNGAGKTTIIKLILGMLHADTGNISIFDKSIKNGNYNVNEDIGFVIGDMFFSEELKINELNIIAKDIFKKWDSDLFFGYLKKFELPLDTKIKKLSTGMKRKLQIIFVLSYKPKLLIFDEATSGLDPIVRREILDLFSDYMRDEENTILMSTHIMTDLDEISDEIIMIDNGNIIFKDSLISITDEYGILKCDEEIIASINRKNLLAKVATKYNWEVLVNNKNELLKSNPDYIIENVSLEKMMFLLSKGGLEC